MAWVHLASAALTCLLLACPEEAREPPEPPSEAPTPRPTAETRAQTRPSEADCLDEAVGPLPGATKELGLALAAGDLTVELRGNDEAAIGAFNGLTKVRLGGNALEWLGPVWNFEHVFDGVHHQPGVDLGVADVFEPRGVHGWKVGRCYTFDQRILISPFQSRQAIVDAYQAWSGVEVPGIRPEE